MVRKVLADPREKGQARLEMGRWWSWAHATGPDVRRPAAARGAGDALVFDPQLVLMDEALGALDKQPREHMQIWN